MGSEIQNIYFLKPFFDGKKKTKEITCYECKKSGHIRIECPKLKHKNKGAKDRKKAFKATWDDFSKFEKEEEQEEVANLCFMALEDKNKVCLKSTRTKNK